MAGSMDSSLALTLTVDQLDARARIERAVDDLLARNVYAPHLLLAVDGDRLPAPLVATLVTGLRRLREVGGAIAVEPLTPALRDALALHGLDRVFALPLEAPRRARVRPSARRPRSEAAFARH